ncbi:SurA N-terminal domain-containing protein [Patescibacteria group bacterium]|nr:SurA N-terminal domain-containing protein [Patescibacteria group bacterium]
MDNNNNSEVKENLESPDCFLKYHPIVVKLKKIFNLKTTIIIACIIIVGSFLFAYKNLFIVATVDGYPISRLAIINNLEDRLGKGVLEDFIIQKIIDKEADREEIVVSDDEINAEIKNIENQIEAQGGTLDEVLLQENITRSIFAGQISTQKKLEKLLFDDIQITDSELAQAIEDNKIEIPEGEEESYREQIKIQLQQQKLNVVAGQFIDSLRAQTSVRYFINY